MNDAVGLPVLAIVTLRSQVRQRSRPIPDTILTADDDDANANAAAGGLSSQQASSTSRLH